MMTRFSTLGACETICAGPYLGEYSHSELSLKKMPKIDTLDALDDEMTLILNTL